jgi:hypothetical protein
VAIPRRSFSRAERASDHTSRRRPGRSPQDTIPLAAFVLGIWALAIRPHADRVVNTALPLTGLLVLADPLMPVPFALTATILAGAVAVLVWRRPIESR